ncbi:MAG: flippase-like domain-containing protein [Deltaproteobacteria bacterium]|nr:flippase-like domain-containing protein [Deltaproteobacteria bacterium]
MKRLFVVAAGLGLVLAVAIIAYEGFGAVTQAFAAVGFGLVVVIVLRGVQIASAGLGWWIIFPPEARSPLHVCLWVRFIREAINNLLPVAQVGGDIVGTRLMTFFGIAAGLAGATVLVDILMQVVTQFLFTIVGIGVLAIDGADDALLGSMVVGTVIMGVALAGFFAAQRFGGAKLIDRALMALAEKLGWSSLANLASLHENLVRIYADVTRFAVAMLVHVSVWFVGALEVLVALRLMGYPVSYTDALVIESLGQAVRAAAFLVPGALGVQEAGFVAVCAVFGIPAAEALALSLVKRVPDIVLGLPFLFAWHAHEARALIRRGPVKS